MYSDNTFMLVVAVLVAAALLLWVQGRWLKKMSLVARLLFVGIGAFVLGGVFYGTVYGGKL
jgi:hypothetical protein